MEDKKIEETQTNKSHVTSVGGFGVTKDDERPEARSSASSPHSRFGYGFPKGNFGYKATTSELKCCNYFQYEIGKWFIHKKEIVPCESGFHLCERLIDVFKYYEGESRYFIVEYGNNYIKCGDKIVTDQIRLIMEINYKIAYEHILEENSLEKFKFSSFIPWEEMITLYKAMGYRETNCNLKTKYIDDCLLIHTMSRHDVNYDPILILQLLQHRIHISKFKPDEDSCECNVYIRSIIKWAINMRYFNMIKLIAENGGKITKEDVDNTYNWDTKIAEYLTKFLPK